MDSEVVAHWRREGTVVAKRTRLFVITSRRIGTGVAFHRAIAVGMDTMCVVQVQGGSLDTMDSLGIVDILDSLNIVLRMVGLSTCGPEGT